MIVLDVSSALLVNYVLLFARSSGFVVFLPMPGLRGSPVMARIVLAGALTVVAAPAAWGLSHSRLAVDAAGPWLLAEMIVAEGVFGVALGAAVALLLEAFGLAAQMLGFQAGYSYVNMVDPTTQVDASILNVMIALLASLFFFAFDLHLHLIRAWLIGLQEWPLGAFFTRPADALVLVHLGGAVFETAIRLSLPVVSVLLLIDLTLGLLNQVNTRLQLLTLAFPSKIIGAVALLYPLLLLTPSLFQDLSEEAFTAIWSLVRR